MQDYRQDYQIRQWNGLADLAVLLNTLCNDGWRVDNHKLSGKDGEDKGWTIFTKTITLRKPLLERNINVGEVYRILNRVLEAGSEQARDFDRGIKEATRLPNEIED
jgi:hypothetical protein